MKAINEKRITEQFAVKQNISIEEINAKAQEVYDSYDEKDFGSDDARWARAYRRVRHAFGLKAKTMVNAIDGMIVCRMPNRDFNRKQYDFAMNKKLEEGEEAALGAGLINADGQPIYQWGDAKGQVICDDNNKPGRPSASGRAIAYTFTQDDEGQYVDITPRFVVINKQRTDNLVPVCQKGKIALSIADQKQKNFVYAPDNHSAFYNDASISHNKDAGYDYNDVSEILGQWNRAFGDKMAVISNYNDLDQFGKEHAFSSSNKEVEYDFCVIPGTVVGIVPGGMYKNAMVTLEFFDYETDETSLITVFLPEPMLQGLNMHDDDQGIFVLQSIGKKDGSNMWHLGGFLHIDDDVAIETFFGINMEDRA